MFNLTLFVILFFVVDCSRIFPVSGQGDGNGYKACCLADCSSGVAVTYSNAVLGFLKLKFIWNSSNIIAPNLFKFCMITKTMMVCAYIF